MAVARFLLVRSDSSRRPGGIEWPGPVHGPEVLWAERPGVVGPRRPGTVPVPVPQVWFSWRLLGRNNRELGRCPVRFLTERACRADLERAAAALRRGSGQVVVLPAASSGWTWRWGAVPGPCTVGARSYQRRRDAESCAAQFLVDGAAAELPPVVPPG